MGKKGENYQQLRKQKFPDCKDVVFCAQLTNENKEKEIKNYKKLYYLNILEQ